MRRLFPVLVLFLSACNGSGDSPTVGGRAVIAGNSHWIGSWAAAPYGPYPLGPLSVILPLDAGPLPPLPVFPGNEANNQSFRMIVHPTLGGSRLRLRFSNLMGDRPVTFGAVRVAKSLNAAGPIINPTTDHAVTFNGKPNVIIPIGRETVSDPVELPVMFGDDLAVSFFVEGESGPMTWHAVAFSPTWVGLPGTGDTTTDPTGLTFTQPSIGWYFISGVDVEAPHALGAIVAIGDSITDGAFEVPASNTRWPDLLAQRLHGAGIEMGVLNQGINSNTVTRVVNGGGYGPPALDRFDRDVLGRPGVRSVIIFEGTNDLDLGPAKAESVFAGITELAQRAHRAGLCVVAGTITPRNDPMPIYGWDAGTMEPEREKLNALIRASHAFDAIADFDAALESPLLPNLPNSLYYFPDQLHPNTLGFQVIADTVPVEALVPGPAGSCQSRVGFR